MNRKKIVVKGLVLFFSVFSLVVLATSNILATEYYVSSSDPNGNDSGPGTEAQPWKTLNKIETESLAGTFLPGDQILLKRGDSWNESFSFQSNGNENYHITISSYIGSGGSENDPPPLINVGSNDNYGIRIKSSCVTISYINFTGGKDLTYVDDHGEVKCPQCNYYPESGCILVLADNRQYHYDEASGMTVFNDGPEDDFQEKIILSNITSYKNSYLFSINNKSI